MYIASLVKIHWFAQVWWKSIDTYSNYCPKTEIRMCCWQITLSKTDNICLLAIPNQISIISMHTPSLVKIHWFLLKLSSEIKIWTCCGQITVKIHEICPLAIPNQISTISMHTPSLVKINWHLLKLSYGNVNMAGWRTDRHTNSQYDTIIHVAGYKKANWARKSKEKLTVCPKLSRYLTQK